MSKVLVIILAVVGVLIVGILVLAFVGGVGVFLASDGERGSGNIVTEIRNVDGFDRVDTCCGLKLNLQQGESNRVAITGDDNLVPEIQTNVRSNTLVVKWDTTLGPHHPTRQIVCDVTIPTVTGVELSGGAVLETTGLTGDKFTLKSSGGSDAQIDRLEVDEFDLDSSGGGNTSIDSGRVTEQTIRLNSGDKLRAADLESESADIELSGGSDAVIWVTDSMVLKVSGGSKVTYYGSPTVEQDVSGGGQVQSKDEQ